MPQVSSNYEHILIRARCSQGVTGDALGGREEGTGSPEQLVDRHGLGHVVERGGGAVGVDVGDVGRLDAGLLHRQFHARDRADTAGGWGGDVVGVGGAGPAQHLGQDGDVTFQGHVPLLEREDARSLPHDEAVAVGVERPGDTGGRERRHVRETGHRGAHERRLTAAGQNHVASAVGDQAGGVGDGVGACGAGRAGILGGPLEAVAHRHRRRCGIGHHHRYQERGDPSFTLVVHHERSEERRVGKECRSRWSPYH